MPVDASGKERRSYRKPLGGAEERHREQESKRSRGEIACAECCRLKVKCDKKLPCASCIRRGCATLCPNGMLLNGNGTRVLVDTDQLRLTLGKMSERIRQLEDALGILTSPNGHQLLQEELLAVKHEFTHEINLLDENPTDGDLANDFSTLAVSEDGVSRTSTIAGAEGRLIANLNIGLQFSDDRIVSLLHPIDVKRQDGDNSNLSERIRVAHTQLPSRERASGLCETYMEQFCWVASFVDRSQLIDELFAPVYKNQNDIPDMDEASRIVYSQELGLLFMVFASAALVDLTLPPRNDEAEDYYQVAKSLVTFEMATANPSLTVVQVLILMTIYGFMSDRGESMDRMFATWCLTAVLGGTIKLFNDPGELKIDQKIIERRRHIYWQLFSMETLQSTSGGPPLPFATRFWGCKFPGNDTQAVGENGSFEVGYWRWRYQFAKEIIYPLKLLTSRAGPIKYSEILALDRKIREMSIPKHLQIPSEGCSWETDGPFKTMGRLSIFVWRNLALRFIHRSFFAAAMLKYPSNPLKSPYASSFLAAYSGSLSLLKVTRQHYQLCPDFMSRLWVVWKHVFSSLIIVGTVVIRGPNSSLAPAALEELIAGVDFFTKASESSRWARCATDFLIVLRDNARRTYTQHRDAPLLPNAMDTSQNAPHAGANGANVLDHSSRELGGDTLQSSTVLPVTPVMPLPETLFGFPPKRPEIPLATLPPGSLSQHTAATEECSAYQQWATHSGLASLWTEQSVPSTSWSPDMSFLTQASSQDNVYNALWDDAFRPSGTDSLPGPDAVLWTADTPDPMSIDMMGFGQDLGMTVADSTMDGTWMSFLQNVGLLQTDPPQLQ